MTFRRPIPKRRKLQPLGTGLVVDISNPLPLNQNVAFPIYEIEKVVFFRFLDWIRKTLGRNESGGTQDQKQTKHGDGKGEEELRMTVMKEQTKDAGSNAKPPQFAVTKTGVPTLILLNTWITSSFSMRIQPRLTAARSFTQLGHAVPWIAYSPVPI